MSAPSSDADGIRQTMQGFHEGAERIRRIWGITSA